MATSFFGGAFFGGEFFSVSTTQGAGRRKRKRTRYAAKIEGNWKYFDSIEEIEGYLASLREEKIEKVVEKVSKAKFGAIKIGDAPPRIRITKAEPELVQIVDRENDRLRAEYIRIMLALKESEDDDDMLLLH